MPKKRKGMLSLGIAMWMLLFSLIAGTVIYNLSANLMGSIRKLDVGKEERYSRIVMKSMVNGLEAIDRQDLGVHEDPSLNSHTRLVFRFAFGSGLNPFTAGANQTQVVTFTTTATMVLDDDDNDVEVFDIFTKPSRVTEHGRPEDGEGIIIQVD